MLHSIVTGGWAMRTDQRFHRVHAASGSLRIWAPPAIGILPTPRMKITSVNADARFDNTEFSDEIVDGRARWIHSTYTCPACGLQIAFKEAFRTALRQNRTRPRRRLRLSSMSSSDASHFLTRSVSNAACMCVHISTSGQARGPILGSAWVWFSRHQLPSPYDSRPLTGR